MAGKLSSDMTTRTVAFAAAWVSALVATAPLGAQIIRVPERTEGGRPVHASAGVGFLDSQGRYDGPSGTYWSLGQGFQLRGSVAVGFRVGAFGVAASQASLPVVRTGGSEGTLRGDVDLRMFLVTFRTPETDRVHQIIEVSTGLAQWADLRGDGTITPGEEDARNAWALLVGYGIGIPLGSAASITIVQDLGTIVGSKSGVPAGTTRVVRQYTTRLGFRLRLAGARR
jgi:hypothetical protein